MLNKKAQSLVSSLGLEKHPEGGYFTQVYQCSSFVSSKRGPKRRLASSIYYLLPAGETSRFHRLCSDELWYYHAGDPVTIHLIEPDGELKAFALGTDIQKGEQPQAVVRAGAIFGATSEGQAGYSLVGCMVSPGFDYEDFELMDRGELLKNYPAYKNIILKLT